MSMTGLTSAGPPAGGGPLLVARAVELVIVAGAAHRGAVVRVHRGEAVARGLGEGGVAGGGVAALLQEHRQPRGLHAGLLGGARRVVALLGGGRGRAVVPVLDHGVPPAEAVLVEAQLRPSLIFVPV